MQNKMKEKYKLADDAGAAVFADFVMNYLVPFPFRFMSVNVNSFKVKVPVVDI